MDILKTIYSGMDYTEFGRMLNQASPAGGEFNRKYIEQEFLEMQEDLFVWLTSLDDDTLQGVFDYVDNDYVGKRTYLELVE